MCSVAENDFGIFLYFSDHNVISENTVMDSAWYGIVVLMSYHGNNIRENKVINNGYGIALSGCWYSTIEENVALQNKEFDLYWEGTGPGNVWMENEYETRNW